MNYSNHLSTHKEALALLERIISMEALLFNTENLIKDYQEDFRDTRIYYDLNSLYWNRDVCIRWLGFAKRNYAVLSGKICQGGLPMPLRLFVSDSDDKWPCRAESIMRERSDTSQLFT